MPVSHLAANVPTDPRHSVRPTVFACGGNAKEGTSISPGDANFAQHPGTPTDGIVQSVAHGKYLKVDFEDCTLMGYKVFGVKVEKDTEDQIQYSTRGSCHAYVQFEQEVPKGFHRLGHWPADVFTSTAPPEPEVRWSPLLPAELVRSDLCELSPVVWRNRLCHLECVRPGSGGVPTDYHLRLTDEETGEELARFAEGY